QAAALLAEAASTMGADLVMGGWKSGDTAAAQVMGSCCTGNRVYNRYFTSDERPAKVKPIPWEAAWVFAAARAFAEDSPLHKATTGTHSCYLVLGGTVT
ncbi:hypothetical protein NE591_15020, partial [Adlercreutzia sp. DFI.6.23]|nr:hypothetical protein [Adlercreutzia sp. DFI.6.23]